MLTNILILVLIVLCAFLYYQQKNVMKNCKAQKVIDNFEPEDQYLHESMNVFNDVKFSLDCCPSTYSSDKGCACINTDTNQFSQCS